MKSIILSEDFILVDALKEINVNLINIKKNTISMYLNDFSNEQKIVFIDDRIQSINILKLRNAFRARDWLVRLCFFKNRDVSIDFQYCINSKSSLCEIQNEIDKILELKLPTNFQDEYLTEREAEVLSLMLKKFDAYKICKILALDLKTIYGYRAKIIRKYNCQNLLSFYNKLIVDRLHE